MTNNNTTTKTPGGKKAAPERNSAATEKGKTLPVNNIQPNAQKSSSEETPRRIMAAASLFLGKGYSVIPCYATGNEARGKALGKNKGKPKVPAVPEWKPFTKQAISLDVFSRYCSGREFPADAIAVIGGAVSGNLVVLDFDNHNGADCVFDEWKGYVKKTEAGKALFARLYVEQSQSGGVHVMTRLEKEPGDPKEKVACTEDGTGVIEARWNGYTLCAPTPGYTRMQGRPDECPTITPDEWEILLTAATRCDKRPLKGLGGLLRRVEKEDRKGWAKTPGDAYNARENALDEMREMLLENGWTPAGDGKLEDGTPCEHYTRPGKDEGPSASLIIPLDGLPVFHVFTSNAPPLDPEDDYSPFALYSMLKHGGDFKAAAAALHAEGYGEKDTASKKTPGINELADGFLAEWDAARTVNGGHCLKLYRGTFYGFGKDSGGWRELDEKTLEGFIGDYLRRRHVDITTKRRKDIIASLSVPSLCLIPSTTEAPFRFSTRETLDRAAVIPVKNGVLRIPDGAKSRADLQLEPLTEDIFSPYSLPVPYDPAAKAPTFARYLLDVLPEEDDRETVRRMFGYALTPDRRLQVFFILYGEPATGKSSAILPLAALLGQNLYSTRPYEQLGDKFAAADLAGKLLNWAGEIHFTDLGLSEERIKQITGGEPVTVERKYMPAYTAPATALLVFASNELPKLRDKTGSILRRLRMILFETVIDPEKRDATLQEKIGRELPGVLNFALEGLIELRKLGRFPESRKGKELIEEVRGYNDPFPEAIAECTVKKPGAFLLAKDLCDRLRAFFLSTGNRRYAEMSNKALAVGVKRTLGAAALSREGGTGRMGYKGLKLR